MPSQIDHVLDLEDADLDRLTYMLARPPQYGTSRPSRKWLNTQAHTISTLPEDVLRPSKLIPRLAVKITERCAAPALPPAAVLCSTHRDLHPWLIRAVFNLVAAEATLRSDRLSRHQPEEGDEVGELAKTVLGILASVNALWLEEEHFKTLFGDRAGHWGAKLHRVKGGCEACILAVVGARGELLAALRANLVGRARSSAPRLLRVVESWIGWFGEAEAEVLLVESDEMAKGVKVARRATKKKTRKERKICPHGCRLGEGGGSHQNDDWRTPGGRRTGGSQSSPPDSPRGSSRSQESPRTPRESQGCRGASLGSPLVPGEMTGSPVREEHIADWYTRSEIELGSTVPTRNMHPAFQPSTHERPENSGANTEAVPKAPSSHGGYTSILDCYGNTDAGASGRERSSWATCTVHTSQSPGHNPTPPGVPIPQLPAQGAYDLVEDDSDGEDVPIYACSSVYSGTGTVWPTVPDRDGKASMWKSQRDPGTVFRDPFAEDRKERDREGSSAGPPAGWI